MDERFEKCRRDTQSDFQSSNLLIDPNNDTIACCAVVFEDSIRKCFMKH